MPNIGYQKINSSKRAREHSAFCLSVWNGRDAIMPWLKAHDCEHLSYENLGHEWVIRDTIPLNKYHHRWFVTNVRKIAKGFGHKRTKAQVIMAYTMRAIALVNLPIIWLATLVLSIVVRLNR